MLEKPSLIMFLAITGWKKLLITPLFSNTMIPKTLVDPNVLMLKIVIVEVLIHGKKSFFKRKFLTFFFSYPLGSFMNLTKESKILTFSSFPNLLLILAIKFKLLFFSIFKKVDKKKIE